MNSSRLVEQYVRLTGKKRTFTGFSQAWLGGDHLLIVHSIRFVERYSAFRLVRHSGDRRPVKAASGQFGKLWWFSRVLPPACFRNRALPGDFLRRLARSRWFW